MKSIIIAIVFAMTTAAAAAQSPMPRSVPLTDSKTGKVIGTATFANSRIFLRDAAGELIAQIIIEADGTRTMLDPHGKVLDRIEGDHSPLALPLPGR